MVFCKNIESSNEINVDPRKNPKTSVNSEQTLDAFCFIFVVVLSGILFSHSSLFSSETISGRCSIDKASL